MLQLFRKSPSVPPKPAVVAWLFTSPHTSALHRPAARAHTKRGGKGEKFSRGSIHTHKKLHAAVMHNICQGAGAGVPHKPP